ncbi:hypothetical protein C0989_009859 [Termitomyces sp. Mn162]|nr:hypothetical protein C0989_009859 [Termitomyces sp. Mn162]
MITSRLLPKPPHFPGVPPPNISSTHPNLCSLMAPAPANSNASLANPDNLLADPNTFSAGPVIPPSPPKPLGPSNISSDPGTHL